MARVAFLFSGQGDQFPGMGRELYERFAEARTVFDALEKRRPGTLAQCFEGTQEELTQTINAQPCLFAQELSAARVLKAHGINPVAVAGFSLGEVTALAVSGALDAMTAFDLVCARARLMASAAQAHETGMVAVVKLDAEKVVELCAGFDQVYPVNFNAPGQTVVSGLSASIPAFSQAVKEAGGRALPLKVSGAFHSPFMASAARGFAHELAGVTFARPEVALYSNVTGKPYELDASDGGPARIGRLLCAQIESPVLWELTVRNLRSSGIDTFIEVGPGKTLTNLVKRIEPEARAYAVAALDTILSEVEPC